MNKILITIQGRTLILYYQVKHGLLRKNNTGRTENIVRTGNTGQTGYIEVLPSDELSRFDLKGLTPEMFCVNITDMVNIRGLYSGQVENEKQIPVARWTMSKEEFQQAISAPSKGLTHLEIVNLLAPLPGYIKETDNQYIDFEESIVTHQNGEHTTFSGYRLTIATEDIEGNVSSYAYYYLDTRTPQGWQGSPPSQGDFEAIRIALENKLQAIKDAGVQLAQVYDETDYALAN